MFNQNDQSDLNREDNLTDTRPTLRTDRLLLRPFIIADAAQLQALLNDRVIAANTRSIPFPYTAEAGRQWIQSQPMTWLQGRSAVFAICDSIDHGLMGAIGIEIEENDQHAELGFWIGGSFRGRGYCSEAAQAVVAFGFKTLALNKIHSQHLSRNPASGRVLQKIGMTQEGFHRKHIRKWGVFEDVVSYGILASDHGISN